MKKRSFNSIEKLDPLAQQFLKEVHSRCANHQVHQLFGSRDLKDMTFCCPDFSNKRHSYMTILTKIINNGGTMSRKDIIGQHKVLPKYDVWDYKRGCSRPRRPTETIDKNRGRASATFQRLKVAKLVTSDSKGYHITEDGRTYVEIISQLKG